MTPPPALLHFHTSSWPSQHPSFFSFLLFPIHDSSHISNLPADSCLFHQVNMPSLSLPSTIMQSQGRLSLCCISLKKKRCFPLFFTEMRSGSKPLMEMVANANPKENLSNCLTSGSSGSRGEVGGAHRVC